MTDEVIQETADNVEEGRDAGGRFTAGNRFSALAKNAGRPRMYEDPQKLLEDCLSYFQWVEQNPFFEDKVFCSAGDILNGSVSKPRPPTKGGLCMHLGITFVTWDRWKDREDIGDMVNMIDEAIYTEQLEGASAGVYNSNIIARLIGLADKQETKGFTATADVSQMTNEELTEALREIFK